MMEKSRTMPQANSKFSQTIELHIEELVLHGFPPTDRHALGDAVEHELARLLAEQGLPHWLASGGGLARVDGGKFDVAPGAQPDGIGAQVAQAVFRGLGK